MRASTAEKGRLSTEFRLALGAEIRRRRLLAGKTQAQLSPFSKAYISSVEHGRCLPSLAALILVAERLGSAPGELLDDARRLQTPRPRRPRRTGAAAAGAGHE